jgi:hypothetical protein
MRLMLKLYFLQETSSLLILYCLVQAGDTADKRHDTIDRSYEMTNELLAILLFKWTLSFFAWCVDSFSVTLNLTKSSVRDLSSKFFLPLSNNSTNVHLLYNRM